MKLFAILVVCVLASKINGISGHKCGEQLTQLLWVVCENGFNGLLHKRSGLSQPAIDVIESDIPYPYASSSLANIFQVEAGNLLAKTRRIRMMGIVDECCKKQCTINELNAYCN